jgi:hypothetical protein
LIFCSLFPWELLFYFLILFGPSQCGGFTGEESTVSDEDLPFEEPKAALPREVRGMANQLAFFFTLEFWLTF